MQIASALMIAVFFTAFATSVRTVEVRWWMRAWLANLGALAATLFYWYFQPADLDVAIRTLYITTKMSFTLFMIEGAWSMAHAKPIMSSRQRLAVLGAYALAGGLSFSSLARLGIGQHSLMAMVFVIGTVIAIRSRRPASSWLAAAFIVRAVLAIVETIAYLFPANPRAAIFLSASSSFDSGAEWFMTLACVLVVSARIQSELRGMNHDLVAVQEELRALADRDPLTGLANRRSLPGVFRDVFESGATILFFDLDGFKEVNDMHGHQAGDEYLKRFAAALRASFRPDDAVVRYAGDEFVVVAPGLDDVQGHLSNLGRRLEGIIPFSAGISRLFPRGSAEQAIREADEAMYRSKADGQISAGTLP